jgi:hypothetical protein
MSSYEKSHKIKRPRMEPNQPITTQTTDTIPETPTPQKQPKIWLPIHPTVLQRLSYFIQTHKIPHLLFHGNSGTGKRTIVNQFIREIYQNSQKQMESNVMYVNCAHEKGIQFIRGEIKTFARINVQQYNPQPLPPQKSQQHQQHEMFKIIVLQNADRLTIDAQSALRRSIEIYSHNTRFFIIVENIQKIMNPILSRFCEIYIPDRMDTEGNVIPLHHFYQYFTPTDSQPPQSSSKFQQQEELAKIPGLIINPTTTPQQWMELCSTFYEKGISAYELVQFAPHFLLPSLKAELEIEFQKVKSEFRCEKLLMFYLIYFLVSRLHFVG